MNPTVEIREEDKLPVTEDVVIDAEDEGETADDGK